MTRRDYTLIATRRGVRMVQHGTLLSEVRASPGPTHSVADVIAASVQSVKPGCDLAMLGFAGGGVLAPLRGMGGDQAVSAVDLDASGWDVFSRLCSKWAGRVKFEQAEACAWLRGDTRNYDVIIEDLSVPRESDVFKPAVTWSELPPLIYRRLNAGGIAIFNLLRPTDHSWKEGIQRVVKAGYNSRIIEFRDYENRLLIAGQDLPSARALGRQIRSHLRRIRSRLAQQILVKSSLLQSPATMSASQQLRVASAIPDRVR